ncbi:YbgC/FadM family acyl-CoA thioesterase [Comamonas sp. J-3]|uniref:YbgC/FadM family acyl-CoA thioesterase n=1 Tax=Comamonas trifloxystrobinivorans TaxID=3350256 RepID=UPI00372BFEE8
MSLEPLTLHPQPATSLADFRCRSRQRVRWSEVDLQKVVFNAHYLNYVDIGMSEYWRQLAVPYEEGVQRLGGELFLKATQLEYHASARLDDVLDIGIRCAKLGNTSVQFEAGIFCADKLLVSATMVYVFADSAQKPQRLPDAYRQMAQRYEAGEPMVEVKTGSWNVLGQDAMRLRMQVFVREQGIPVEIEADEFDVTSLHAVAINGLGMCVATGRMLPSANEATRSDVMRIGRMAVARPLRGTQLGRQVLDALVDAAQRHGKRQVELHAQRTAENFYRRAGFTVVGEPYEEAGIAHISMVKDL